VEVPLLSRHDAEVIFGEVGRRIAVSRHLLSISGGCLENAFSSLIALFRIPEFCSGHRTNSDRHLVDFEPGIAKNCSGGHGKTAEGRHFAGPSLKSDKVAAASDSDLRNMIANGKGRMPKFTGKLTSDEIDTLVRQSNKKYAPSFQQERCDSRS
jgi:Cytochrome C oxidase, cbb3-type, subunit III